MKHSFFYQPLAAALIAFVLVVSTGCGASKKSSNTARPTTTYGGSEKLKSFSEKLGLDLPDETNEKLAAAVADWLNTPYQFGGNQKSGVDCSGFIGQVYQQVYSMSTPRTTTALYQNASPLGKSELKEGDLVFFKIKTSSVGHAGIYICCGYFAHASTSRGVILSRLDEPYWQQYFVSAGRLLK